MSYANNQSLKSLELNIYAYANNYNRIPEFNETSYDLFTGLVDAIATYNAKSHDYAVTHRFDYYRRCELINRSVTKPVKVIFEWSVV